MEETKGIPDVAGLTDFVKANTEQPSEEKPRDDKGQFVKQPTGQAELKRLKSFQNPDGTLNLENVDKSYGEIQGLATKNAQENKELKEQLAQMQEQMRLMHASYQQPVVQPQTQAPDFDTQFINDPKKAIDNVVNQRVTETIRTMTVQEVLSREQIKNPDEFHDRYNYAMRARQMYPNLVNSSAGVEMLFQLGDKMRESDLRRNAGKTLKAVLGDDVDLEKFKALVKKDQSTDPVVNKQDLAYMPDSSGAFRTGPPSGSNVQSHETAINDAVQKGDPDTVLQHLFRKKLSAT